MREPQRHGGHKERANEISQRIIGAAIAVHRELGPGLLESAYEACLKYELKEVWRLRLNCSPIYA
jgi:PD-(D/E)XK nuclease superfamily